MIYLMITLITIFLKCGTTEAENKILDRSKENFCPQSIPDWTHDAEMFNAEKCSMGTKYHCVETQIQEYVKVCAVPRYISAGYFSGYSEAGDQIYAIKCSYGTFRSTLLMSNEFEAQSCKSKHKCKMEGEFVCDEGSYTEDRQCGCNYTAGWAVETLYVENPQNLTCRLPGAQFFRCIHVPCDDNNKQLNPAYKCVDKCRTGFYRPWRSFECVPSPQGTTHFPDKDVSESISLGTTTVPKVTTKAPKTSMLGDGKSRKEEKDEPKLITPVITIVSICVMLIVVVFFIHKYRHKQIDSDQGHASCFSFTCCPKHNNHTVNVFGGNNQFGKNNQQVIYSCIENTPSGPFLGDEESSEKEPLLPPPPIQTETPAEEPNSTPDEGQTSNPVQCHEDLITNEIKKQLERFTERIKPELFIPKEAYGPDLNITSHGLYFSFLFLMIIHYKEKIQDITNAYSLYQFVKNHFAWILPNQCPNIELDGLAKTSPSDDSFAGEFTLYVMADQFDVPLEVVLMKEDSITRKRYPTQKASANYTCARPTLHIGCVQIPVDLGGYCFVPLQCGDLDVDASLISEITDYGEELNKEEDNNSYYFSQQSILKADVHESIAFIQVDSERRPVYGTGYRAGSAYVITAFHVIKDAYALMWDSIFDCLQNDTETLLTVYGEELGLGNKEVSRNSIPEEKLHISSLIQHYRNGDSRRERIEEAGKRFGKKVNLEFGYIKESTASQERKKYNVCFDFPYADRKEDIVVLKILLADDGDITSLPKRFLFLSDKVRLPSVHVFGYPSGKALQFDPGCITVMSEDELNDVKKSAIDFFSYKLKPTLIDSKKEKVCKEYKDLTLQTGEKLLFHCSESFNKGASGGPLLIYDETIKAPVVVGTIQKGIPWSYFNNFDDMQKKAAKKKFKILLESGLTSSRLRSLLDDGRYKTLHDDIFNKEKDHRTILPAKIQAPGCIQFSEEKEDSVVLSWRKADSDVPLKKYVIEKNEKSADTERLEQRWQQGSEFKIPDRKQENFSCKVDGLTTGEEYYFRIYGVSEDDQRGLFVMSEKYIPQRKVPPSKPVGPLTITPCSVGSVRLAWQASEGGDNEEIEYNVQIKLREESETSWKNKRRIKETQVNVADLDVKRDYVFQVYAQNSAGRSEPLRSDEDIKIEKLFLPPSIPELRAVVMGTTVELTWATVTEQLIYPVSEYEVQMLCENQWRQLFSKPHSEGNITQRTDALDIRKEYKFSVRARNEIGTGQERESSTVQIKGTPERPGGPLTTTAIDDLNVKLEWKESPGDGGSPITAYLVEKCLIGDRTAWSEIEKTGPNTFSVIYSGLSSGRSYKFRVHAENGNGESEYLETTQEFKVLCVQPQPPRRSGDPTVNGSTITLHWQPPVDDGGSPIERYHITKIVGDSEAQVQESVGSTEDLTMSVDLPPDQLATFLVVAETEQGQRSEPLALGPVKPEPKKPQKEFDETW